MKGFPSFGAWMDLGHAPKVCLLHVQIILDSGSNGSKLSTVHEKKKVTPVEIEM
jgi:hypothetical protein